MKTQQLEEIKTKETLFLYPPKGTTESYSGQHYELQYGIVKRLRFNDGGITPPESYAAGSEEFLEVPTLQELLEKGYSIYCYTPNPWF